MFLKVIILMFEDLMFEDEAIPSFSDVRRSDSHDDKPISSFYECARPDLRPIFEELKVGDILAGQQMVEMTVSARILRTAESLTNGLCL